MAEVNLKKRISTKRFILEMTDFISSNCYSIALKDERGNYCSIEYYLIHSDEFSREEFEDSIKFVNTIQHLMHSTVDTYVENHKTISAEKIFIITKSRIIFNYKYSDPKYQIFQNKLLELLNSFAE